MTYSLDFRMQVLRSIDDGMTFAQASEFYNLSPTTIQYRTGSGVFIANQPSKPNQTKPNLIKYQMMCYLRM